MMHILLALVGVVGFLHILYGMRLAVRYTHANNSHRIVRVADDTVPVTGQQAFSLLLIFFTGVTLMGGAYLLSNLLV